MWEDGVYGKSRISDSIWERRKVAPEGVDYAGPGIGSRKYYKGISGLGETDFLYTLLINDNDGE